MRVPPIIFELCLRFSLFTRDPDVPPEKRLVECAERLIGELLRTDIRDNA